MLFKRFYDTKLAQASYMIGCEACREAIIVDPNRDHAFYLDAAKSENMRIRFVAETHIHADFLSGSRELAAVARAQLFLSAEGGKDWSYRFASSDNATLLRDGDEINFGQVSVRAWHTPGHTPEHLSFVVTDLASANEPIGIVTGDFLFVGDVGRPDLLEKAAQQAGTMEDSARQLFRSLEKLRDLPDYLQIWPGHGAGSACGKSLGALPQSTLGFERISNWALRVSNETEFVEQVLDAQPSPPAYFAAMKVLNRDGPPLIGSMPSPPQLSADEIARHLANGAVMIDARPIGSHAKAHPAGAIAVPYNKAFVKYAGSVLPRNKDICLLVESDSKQEQAASRAKEIARDLAMIDLDSVTGFAPDSIIPALQSAGITIESAHSVSPAAAVELTQSGNVTVLDVRDEHELRQGYLAGARHIPLSVLANRMGELPTDAPVLVYCESGSRSQIAASLIRRETGAEVYNLAGGITAWGKESRPMDRTASRQSTVDSRQPNGFPPSRE